MGNTIAVAEHFFALLLALTRRIVEASTASSRSIWLQGNLVECGLIDLQGNTLGLLGFGTIGQAIARRANAFEIRVC
jgi:phosphoglycerate dehydrogenase-like enzyme